jgi:hypothetical protein
MFKSIRIELNERAVVPRAPALGLRIERVGVKDMVLPGEAKTLLNRVITWPDARTFPVAPVQPVHGGDIPVMGDTAVMGRCP